MPISAGQQLLHYRVVEKIGQGGMGEVWRATDTTLSRDVALKTLPAEVSEEPDRLQRFEREARLLATLNHPNVAAVYGLHEAQGVHFLVMELVGGEDLAERLRRGPLPVGEALDVAGQVAAGLQAAHESGVIHRDLKPANVRITPDGQAKVLDFGLAKAADTRSASGEPHAASLSPTITTAGTAAGVILGTAAYMSPEQARGRPADRRSDIWALGCLLYEMLTGAKLFEGETISDIMAAVLRAEPDWDRLPAHTPSALRRLLRRCLERDPKQRLHDMADARLEIRDAVEERDEPPVGAAARGRRGAALWMLPVIGLVGLAVGWLGSFLREAAPAPARPMHASLLPPEGTWLDSDTSPAAGVLSPDRSKVVFGAVSAQDLVSRLYVRELATGRVEVLENTANAQYPFWSPDSRWVAFFDVADTGLKKVDAGGGPSITICTAENGKGGSWNREGTIVFAPSFGSTIHRVDAGGGKSVSITTMDTSKHNSHRHPRFLPDGRHFVFLARSNVPSEPSAILVGSLDGGETKELMRSTSQVEVARDHLFFVREGTLLAQPFDTAALQLTGEPVVLADGVRLVPGAAYAAFAASGPDLVYNGESEEQQVTMEWWDAEGNVLSTIGDPGYLASLVLSPDESQAAMVLQEGSSGGSMEIWTLDLARGLANRLTTEAGDQFMPLWTADGKSVLYASNHQNGRFAIYRKRVGGLAEAEQLLALPESVTPLGLAPDGTRLLYSRSMAEGPELWLAELGPDGYEEGRPLMHGVPLGSWSQLSPDGRWYAYSSAVEGRGEIYLTPFPEADRRWRVSSAGGVNVVWRRDGKQLLFQQPDGEVMKVALAPTADDPRPGKPEPLFELHQVTPWGSPVAALSDGTRFLVIPQAEKKRTGDLRLVLDWPEMLDRR